MLVEGRGRQDVSTAWRRAKGLPVKGRGKQDVSRGEGQTGC